MSLTLSPLTIKNVTFRNRIVMSPMCQYSATDGFMNDWHMVHLGTRAIGGVGLVFTEATSVSPEGRISPGDAGIWDDKHIGSLTTIVNFLHRYGAMAGIQLAHAGRKASCALPWEGGKQLDDNNGGWQTVGPSDIPFNQGERPPQILNKEGIQKVISDFRKAASRSLEAGFDVVEIHAAHGYLLHEFLSPLSNMRKDEYGGTFENRIRLLTEVVKSIKSAWPDGNPLFVRISSTDWINGGWTPEDSVRLAYILKESGVDLIDCSSGGNVPNVKIPVGPGYQVPFSEAVKKSGILTGAVGMITSSSQAEAILHDNKADMIFMGRELLRNPYFALIAARQPADDIEWPLQYLRSK
ncbi:MAG: NADPH dehydrogenase NamA [Bacteroidia bacterium]|nr:MAG: NADPH dehydrogenase NamA [Bacteroidia bacterium]